MGAGMINQTIPQDNLNAVRLDPVEMDLLKNEFQRPTSTTALGTSSDIKSDPLAELASLRDFNSQLLERVGEFRRQNHQLLADESAMRSALATQEKLRAERESELSEAHARIALLTEALNEQQADFERSKDEMNRKFARLTDDKWSNDLEVDSMRQLQLSLQEEISRKQEEISDLRMLEASLQNKIQELNVAIATFKSTASAEQNDLMSQRDQATYALGQALEKQSQLSEQFKNRENQLIMAFDQLRAEYSNIDKCYKDSVEVIAQLRNSLRETEQGAMRAMNELQNRLQADFQRQFEAVLIENRKLKEKLETRDTNLEVEKKKLQTWQEQLNFLDQHLKQFSQSMKKEKAEVQRLSQQIQQELDIAQKHPVPEYLAAAELEVTNLQNQLDHTSALSPARQKIEGRLAQAIEHREALKMILVDAERKFSERTSMLQTIAKSVANT